MDKRLHYLDALRVIAILMMFLFHVSMVFVSDWGWHIKNPQSSQLLLELNFWMSSFRMPLLFWVSGAISYILMQRMSWMAFSKLRFQRLLIPTFIWTFILVAPQIFFERKLEGSTQGYWEFYTTFLEFQWWPQGNFHWLHLWFIPYLFCYNLLSLPVFHFLRKYPALAEKKIKTSQLLIFVGLAIIPYLLLYPHFPASFDLIHDFARHAFFLGFVLAGLCYIHFKQLAGLIESGRKLFLALAFLSFCLINVLRWNAWEPFNPGINWRENPASYLYLGLLQVHSWMWVLASLGYGRKYLNRSGKRLSYANSAVYPFYILHQTVIVILAFYVVQTQDDLWVKFTFLFSLSFLSIILIYHLFIRPYNFIRYLFGMKKRKNSKME